MSLSAKREALTRRHGRYGRAGRPHKTRIRDEFCATCGYHRKAALRLLNRPLPITPPRRSGPKILYDPVEVLPVLKAVWLASDQLCSKLLKAALPEGWEHQQRRSAPLPEAFKEKLLRISPAQIDRLLRPARVQHPKKGLAATRPGTLLRHAVPTRSGPPDTTRPVRSRPTPSRIATTPPRAIRSIPSRLPSFTAAGPRTAPSGIKVRTLCSHS